MLRNIPKFTDADVVNVEDWIPAGEYNPHKVRPWLLHDCGFTLAVVFASCLQDVLDIAVDNNKLDQFKIEESDLSDYRDDGDIDYLGNACEPFDIDVVDCVELRNPPMSFRTLWKANNS
jgi:hypothetical protein